MGAAAIPIALALASTATSMYNTNRTAKKQDEALYEGLRRQSDIDRKTFLRTGESIGKFEESGPEEISADLSDKYRKQIRLKQGQAFQGLDQPIDLSDEAVAASGKAVDTSNQYAGLLQGLFSQVDAAGEQRRLEGVEQGNLGTDLSVLARDSDAQKYLTDLRVRGVQRSPILDLLAAGLGGASTGLAGGGGGIAASGLSKVPGTPQSFYNFASGQGLPGQYGTPTGKLFSLFGP